MFLGCEVVSVRHTGESIPRGTVRLTELPAGVKKLETTGAGAVVSELRNGDKRFVVIVNRDFKNPMTLQIELDETASRILQGRIGRSGIALPRNYSRGAGRRDDLYA